MKGQPAVVGGPKTFLGEFATYRKVRVAVVSGESGEHTRQETARRVCAAQGVDLASVDSLWAFTLPQLASPLQLMELRRGLKEHGIVVLIIDPLYLCLLAGKGPTASQRGTYSTWGRSSCALRGRASRSAARRSWSTTRARTR